MLIEPYAFEMSPNTLSVSLFSNFLIALIIASTPCGQRAGRLQQIQSVFGKSPGVLSVVVLFSRSVQIVHFSDLGDNVGPQP